MVRRSKSRAKEPEEALSLDDVLHLGGTVEDFESLKDIQDGTGTAKAERKSKKSFKEDEFKEFFKSVGFETIEEDSVEDSVEKKTKPTSGGSTVVKKVTKKDTVVKKGTKKEKAKEVLTPKKPKRDRPALQVELPDITPLQVSGASSTVHESKKTPLCDNAASKLLPSVYNHIVDLASIMPKKMVLKSSGIWYADDTVKLPVENDESYQRNDGIVVSLKDLGKKLLEAEALLFKQRSRRSGEGNNSWIETVSSAGTLSDRVAAYTLMTQQAPIHNYHSLDMFLGMLKKKGKREALIALEALQNIFLAELLPDRLLRFFHEQPIKVLKNIFQQNQGGAMSKRLEIQKYLILWTFEDHVKSVYKIIVDTIRDVFLQDTLEAMKIKGLRVALELLKSKPEQERDLLAMLVDKLGDPKYKIASKALHMLHCLIQEHPVMQGVVVSAVRDLLLRPNIQAKCQYYCICFMSAQILSKERKEVADLLVQIYLAFFKAAVKKKNVDNKLLGAILTGVNRAYPFTNTDDEKIVEELNVLYRTIHVSSFGTSVQAMMLLFQVLSSRNELNDRYYNALYSTLMHPELSISTNRHPMYLNLLFRSLKADPSESRVKAFLKRILQSCTLQHPSYISAVLVLLIEIMRFRPNLKYFLESAIKKLGKGNDFQDDSDEEHFVDLNEDGDIDSKNDVSTKKSENSWTHINLKLESSRSSVYDALHRTPTYASAETSSLWELGPIQKHYHPAVAKFAEQITAAQSSSIPDRYSGDPLSDFTLMRFLDKFVYRNPKARQEKESTANVGESVFRRKRKAFMSQSNDVAANTPEFLNKKSYEPDEVFLQRYFASRAGKIPSTKRCEEEDSDVEELSDDEFDKFLDSADGQAELDTQYKFAEGAMSSSSKRKGVAIPDIEADSGDEFENVDFDEPDEELENDPFGDGMGFADVGEDDEPAPPKRKKAKKESADADFEAFDMMMEDHARQKSGSSGSGAVRNEDNSSSRQLQWERKRETKDIIARKRAGKRTSFGRPGKRQGTAGKTKKAGFTKKGRRRF